MLDLDLDCREQLELELGRAEINGVAKENKADHTAHPYTGERANETSDNRKPK